jgi:hypothetical protein
MGGAAAQQPPIGAGGGGGGGSEEEEGQCRRKEVGRDGLIVSLLSHLPGVRDIGEPPSTIALTYCCYLLGKSFKRECIAKTRINFVSKVFV